MGKLRLKFGLEYWMAGVLLLLPFFSFPYFLPEYQFSLPKLIGLCALALMVLTFYVAKYTHWSIAVLNFIVVFNVFATGFGGSQLYPLVYWLSCVACAVFFIDNKKRADLFFWAIMWSGVGSASYAYVQMMGLDFIFVYAKGIPHDLPISFFGQTTKFGSFMCLTIPIAFARRSWIPAAFMLVPAIATGSSFTVAAIAAGSLVALRPLISKNTVLKIVAGSVIAVAAFYAYKPGSDVFFSHGRYTVWESAIEYTNDKNPVFGAGIGSFSRLYPPEEGPDGKLVKGTGIQPYSVFQHGAFDRAHNDFVEAYFDLGLVGIFGIFLVLCAVYSPYASLWFVRGIDDPVFLSAAAAFSACLVNACGNFPTQMAPQNLITLVSLCVLLRFKNALL